VKNHRLFVNGSTQVAAVIGSPIGHSLSPVLHNAAFAAIGLDWVFTAFEVAEGDLPKALEGAVSLGIVGLSVTMPHKEVAATFADELVGAAARLGAVNCLIRDGGRLIGYNTDGDGFLKGLLHDTGLGVEEKRVLVIGAGGAARAVIEACASSGAEEVVVANRSVPRATTAAALAGAIGRTVDLDSIRVAAARADVIINATPLGMQIGDQLPLDPTMLAAGQLVVDLVYYPEVTQWMAELRGLGIEVYGGLSMLLFQAAEAFTLWTGEVPPVEVMASAARSALSLRQD